MKIYEDELKKCFEGKGAKEIAVSLGICESALSRLLGGNRKLGLSIAKKIVAVVGASQANLLIDWEGLPCLRT